jgi:hypothetical protein
MPNRCSYNLVAANRSVLNLGALAEFRRLWALIPKEREKYYRIHQQTLSVANLYYDQHEQRDYVVRLRIDIRNATRGATPSQGMATPTVAGFVTSGTEQLYNAQQHLLSAAYRKVRSLVHPDSSKLKDSEELFQLVNAAYHMRDLTFLQETYLSIVHAHDLFWQQTHGLEYVKQELQRPKISLRILQSSPEFRISQLHMTRKFDDAAKAADRRIRELIIELTAELQHLLLHT